MRLHIEIEQETDGGWAAAVTELPNVRGHGRTREDAIRAATALSLRALAERIDAGEVVDIHHVAFSIPGPDDARRRAAEAGLGLFEDLAPGRDLADELIRERRDEAARESA